MKTKLTSLILALVGGLAMLTTVPAILRAATITVTSAAESGSGTLRAAIASAANGDTIDFDLPTPAGTPSRIKLTSGELVVERNLTIIGPGTTNLWVTGNDHQIRVVHVTPNTTVTISGLTIYDGFSAPSGGGIAVDGNATLTVNNCVFDDNDSLASGGAIANQGVLIVNNCAFYGNYASNGAGIYNAGTLTANNSTFTWNGAVNGGGIGNAGTLTVINCTFTANYVPGGPGHGSGINNTLIVDGRVRSATLLNCLIAHDLDAFGWDGASSVVEGRFISQGHNLIGMTNGSDGWVASDRVGSFLNPLPPRFGAPSKRGETIAVPLRPDSPAIDAGSSAVLFPPFNLITDQRGFARQFGPSVDIGAVEYSFLADILTSAALLNAAVRVDNTVRLPDGTGAYHNFPSHAAISAGNLAFVGTGSGGQQGVYSMIPPSPIRVVADLNTPIPDGIGNFVSIPTDPCISGQNVAFIGYGSGGQQGVYLKAPVGPCRLVADRTTPIPGGIGNFVSAPNDPCISGENVAFIGYGSGGQQGVYLKMPTDPCKIVADLNTPIPRGTGNFTGFAPSDPCALAGQSVAFIGHGTGGQQGVYVKLPDLPIREVADTNTIYPGGTNRFRHFDSVSYDGSMVAFIGYGPGTFDGPPPPGGRGVFKTAPGGPPFKVADITTPVPGGINFSFSWFRGVVIDGGAVVFLASTSSNPDGGAISQWGIYTDLGGVLSKVIATGDTPNGKTVTNLDFGPFGFSQGQVAFTATFSDGSQALPVTSLCPDSPQTGPHFVVTTAADYDDGLAGSCDCTLREAIRALNASPYSNGMITFAPGVTNTILLVNGELVINTANLTIAGPGAQALTVSGNFSNRVFNVVGGTVKITDLTIRDGIHQGVTSGASGLGGGVFNSATLVLSNCTVSGSRTLGANGRNGAFEANGSPGGSAVGGGIYNTGTLWLVNCTLTQNESRGANGGLGGDSDGNAGRRGGAGGQGLGGAVCNDGTLTMWNCTVNSNFVYGGVGGDGGEGGLFPGASGNGGNAEGAGVINRGSAQLVHVTIDAGLAERGLTGSTGGGLHGTALGAGLRSTTDTTYLHNTLVALNSLGTDGLANNGVDVSGTIQSQGYNLVGIVDGSTGWLSTDLFGTATVLLNPMLGPLQDNGGPTWTQALLPGSPAIDKGTNGGLTTDQRGGPRPLDKSAIGNASGGDGSDIGAFEVGSFVRITAVQKAGNDIRVSFTTDLGASYCLVRRENVASGTWTMASGAIPGTGSIVAGTHTSGATLPKGFYRVRSLP